MEQILVANAIYLLRVIIAAICGFAIGVERRNRLKSAGPRTHLLVCAASCLMMIVSKYGFFDMLNTPNISIDPSRIAANIITGITFMGAGLIFVHKREVSGVTTAAGLWATVGIGMAVGAGMYAIGIGVCVIIILLQLLMHSKLRFFKEPWLQDISISVQKGEDNFGVIMEIFNKKKLEIVNCRIKQGDEIQEIKLTVRAPQNITPEELLFDLCAVSCVISAEY